MERKLREINGSYIITIPKQVCDLYGFKQNDRFNIEPIGFNELRLRKILFFIFSKHLNETGRY